VFTDAVTDFRVKDFRARHGNLQSVMTNGANDLRDSRFNLNDLSARLGDFHADFF
jgi:hypothetical protein